MTRVHPAADRASLPATQDCMELPCCCRVWKVLSAHTQLAQHLQSELALDSNCTMYPQMCLWNVEAFAKSNSLTLPSLARLLSFQC